MGVFLFTLLPYFLFIYFKTRKSLHILQQNYYDESRRYFVWIMKNPKKVWLEIDAVFPITLLLYLFTHDISYVLFF